MTIQDLTVLLLGIWCVATARSWHDIAITALIVESVYYLSRLGA